MIWACDETRGNKSSTCGYENEHCRKKRMKTEK